MVEALLSSLSLVFNLPVMSWLMLGVVLGIWSGSVPGLGGIVALVVILPFTFGMEPIPGMALLLGLWAVTSTSDHCWPRFLFSTRTVTQPPRAVSATIRYTIARIVSPASTTNKPSEGAGG